MTQQLTTSMTQTNKLDRSFLILWLGQLISLIGSSVTQFALGIWVYQETGSITLFSLIAFFTALPTVILAPFAGALIDRWNRRAVMLASDTGAAIGTVIVLLLLYNNQLEIWHLYIVVGVSAILQTFQRPAYMAAVTQLVKPQQLDRANGMVQLSLAAGQLLAPLLGGFLITKIGMNQVLGLDLVTFLFALLSLLLISIPNVTAKKENKTTTIWQDVLFGWRYLRQRQGLSGLLALFACVNFCGAILAVLVTPLVLSFTSAEQLGLILSIGGIGMIVGSIGLAFLGHIERRMYGILLALISAGIFIILAGWKPSTLILTIAAFGFYCCLPMVNGWTTSILQRKVAPEFQGRVFATQNMLISGLSPIGIVLAGPLADRYFEPWLQSDGRFAASVGQIIGTGTGRGIGFMFIVLGCGIIGFAILGLLMPTIRTIDTNLSDHQIK